MSVHGLCLNDTVALWQAGRYHVRISDRFHLIHVVLVDRRVEEEVEIVQKLDNLRTQQPRFITLPSSFCIRPQTMESMTTKYL